MTSLEPQQGVTVGLGTLECQLCGGERTVAVLIPEGYTPTEAELIKISDSWICDHCKTNHMMSLPS